MDNILKTLLRSHEYFSKYLFVKVMKKIFLRRLLGFFYLRMVCSLRFTNKSKSQILSFGFLTLGIA